MAWNGVEERRRGPRVGVADRVDCRFEMRMRVRLVDISASGALLTGDTLLPLEASGQLKAVLASGRFSPRLEIRRTDLLATMQGVQLGDGVSGYGRRKQEQPRSIPSKGNIVRLGNQVEEQT